jgi:septal ring factor EnvC (AmiA/AmiB activator)
MAKYLLIAAIVISLVTAGIGYKNHETLVATKTTLEQTTTTLNQTKANLATTTKNFNETTATLKATEEEKTKLAADLLATQGELKTTKEGLDAATKAGEEKDAKITTLQAEVDKYIALIPKGPTDGDGDPFAEFKRQIEELNAQIASLKEQNDPKSATIAKYAAEEAARKQKQMQKGLEGRVLAVNPAWNFVVISIGDKQGVVSNAELLLKRGDQFLGKVRITSVEPSTSIADIVANTLPEGVSVQPGDTVIFQGND